VVLGFFEDIGFSEQHGLISTEVAHQYFYDDLLYYYQGSREYIADAQKEDPTYFENLKPLFNDLTNFELQKGGTIPRFSDTNYLEYLRSEIELEKK
jgi:hypothetical protein